MAYRYITADNVIQIRQLMQTIMSYLVKLIEGHDAKSHPYIHQHITSALYTIANMMSLGKHTNNSYEDIMEHMSESLSLAEFLIDSIKSRYSTIRTAGVDESRMLPGACTVQLYAGVDVTKN